MSDGLSKKRDGFTSRWGFIMAAVGSAVGMANVWAFPYRTATYGGASFLIPYIICIILLVNTGVVSEIAFGRWAGTGPLGAMAKVVKKPVIKHMGIIPVFAAFAIGTGYAIIMGWVIRYLFGSITGAVTSTQNTGAYFGAICGDFGSIAWHLAALGIAVVVMIGGIAKGIEVVNKFLMPAFFLLFLGMALYMITVPNASKGYAYLFIPHWEYLIQPKTWIFALGQAFFSLSLAGNGTLIYGSYLSKKEDIVSCSRAIGFYDTIAALLATLVIIPAVFAFGMNPSSGPPLMFITLPAIFQAMGGFGHLFSVIFFVAIFFGAASSIVNLFETPIEMIQSKFQVKRPLAVITILVLAAAGGVFLENSDVIGVWMDVMSIYLCPFSALLAAICFYWVMKKKTACEEMQLGRTKAISKYLHPLGKYGYCGIAILVIILGISFGGIG